MATLGPPDALSGPDELLLILCPFFEDDLNWVVRRNRLKSFSFRSLLPGVVWTGPLRTGFSSLSFKSSRAYCSVYDWLANLLNAPFLADELIPWNFLFWTLADYIAGLFDESIADVFKRRLFGTPSVGVKTF